MKFLQGQRLYLSQYKNCVCNVYNSNVYEKQGNRLRGEYRNAHDVYKQLCNLFEMSESADYVRRKVVKKQQKHTAFSLEIKSLLIKSRGWAGKRTLRDLLKQPISDR